MKLRKAEIAEVQINEAIRQFLDRGDLVCAVTLAGAAEEIFGSLLKRQGIANSLEELYEAWNDGNRPELPWREFVDKLNLVKNQIKHAGDPAYDELDIGQADAMVLIARAAGMHRHFADRATPELVRFREWWLANAEGIFSRLPTIDEVTPTPIPTA